MLSNQINPVIKDDAKQYLDISSRHALCWIHPEIPLHNNCAEIAVREGVIKRKISYGTRSDLGKLAWEYMLSIMDTCRKLK